MDILLPNTFKVLLTVSARIENGAHRTFSYGAYAESTLTYLQALGQICSTASMTHNLGQAQVLVRSAVAAGAKVGSYPALSISPAQ